MTYTWTWWGKKTCKAITIQRISIYTSFLMLITNFVCQTNTNIRTRLSFIVDRSRHLAFENRIIIYHVNILNTLAFLSQITQNIIIKIFKTLDFYEISDFSNIWDILSNRIKCSWFKVQISKNNNNYKLFTKFEIWGSCA